MGITPDSGPRQAPRQSGYVGESGVEFDESPLHAKGETTSPAPRLSARLPAASSGWRVSPRCNAVKDITMLREVGPLCAHDAGDGFNTNSRQAGRRAPTTGLPRTAPFGASSNSRTRSELAPKRAAPRVTCSLAGRAVVEQARPLRTGWSTGSNYLYGFRNGKMVTDEPPPEALLRTSAAASLPRAPQPWHARANDFSRERKARTKPVTRGRPPPV